jgi:hypothetical protein
MKGPVCCVETALLNRRLFPAGGADKEYLRLMVGIVDDTTGGDDDNESTAPEITMDDLPADTLSLLRDHLSAQASDWPEKDGQSEDYKLSQFWYTAGTAKALVDEVCEVNDCHRLSVCLSSSCRCGSVTAGSGF